MEVTAKPVAANDNNPLFYVYIWRRPDGEPFYVGKGRKKRAHDIYDRSEDFLAIYHQGGCEVEIVDWFIHESQALAYEMELIAQYGRRQFGGLLVNRTDGGDGCVGHVKSAEALEKWRAKNVGKRRDEQTKARISAAKMGHPVSEESRAKMSASGMRRFEDPAEREKIRARVSDPSEETRSKMSSSQKRRFSDMEQREKARERATGKKHTTATKRKISASTVGIRKDEATVESMRRAQRLKPPKGQFKGVSRYGSKWQCIITVDGNRRYLGSYERPEEAAEVYDRAAIEAWGYGNCYLNTVHVANDNASIKAFA